MKKLLLLLSVFTSIFALTACGAFSSDTDDGETLTYTAIDINPSIEIIVDEDNTVVTVAFLNEDAEIVGADLELIGLPFEEALDQYINAAIETGYIDVDSDENIVRVTSDDEATEENVKENVQNVLESNAVGAAIFGGEIDEEYVVLAEEYDISIGRARLISRAVELDEDLTFEDALELSQQEVMDILVTAHQANMQAFVAERQENAQTLKTEMREGAMDRVQAHRDAVDVGEIDAPDFDAIKDSVDADLTAVQSRYENRIDEARQNARDRKNDKVPNDIDTNNLNYTTIDINPSIEVLVDEDNIVVTVAYLNEDAEIVGADLDLVGLPFDEALEVYINAAIETGYIDVDSDENIIRVTSDNQENEENVKENLQTILSSSAIGAAIFGGEMNEEYAELAEEYDLSIGRVRLISRAVELDEDLTFEAALELSQQEIMAILVTAHQANMEAFVAERQENAQALKTEMREAAMNRVQAHRDAVDADEVELPDYNAIRESVEEELEAIRERYQDRVDAVRQNAQDRKDERPTN